MKTSFRTRGPLNFSEAIRRLNGWNRVLVHLSGDLGKSVNGAGKEGAAGARWVVSQSWRGPQKVMVLGRKPFLLLRALCAAV
jgi:hypothetical protein